MSMPAGSSSKAADGGLIGAGRAALTRGAWEEARATFDAAVLELETAEAVEGKSWAAWWLNEADEVFESRKRAYILYRQSGDPVGAARMATWLGTDHVDFRGELAVAKGWFGRAHRLLKGVEAQADHGWLWVHEADKLLLTNDIVRARELGAGAAALGQRLCNVELEMMGLAVEGLALVTEGNIDDGIRRLDEAAAAAVGGEFEELWVCGWSLCYMIYACERVRDYDRAAEWCKRATELSERLRLSLLKPVCRAHYAGVLIWYGTWAEAERELTESAVHLAEIRPPAVAEATVRLGELRRRQGRLDEAVELFEQATDHPLAPLGLGEVCLDRGDPEGARDHALQYLREVPSPAEAVRAAGLELLIRAHVTLGDREGAVAALDALRSVAGAIATDPLRAAVRFVEGLVAVSSGDSEAARIAFEDAARLFHRTKAPFEAARVRIESARILQKLGRSGDGLREARSASVSLRRMGAAFEAARADAVAQEIDAASSSRSSPLTARECQVLRLVANGRTNRQIGNQLVISEHTVNRHVTNILSKLDSPSRSAAVAEALRRGLI